MNHRDYCRAEARMIDQESSTMSEDAHDVMEGLDMSGDEQRDEIRSATGFAHLDGEIEYTSRCPKCKSRRTAVTGSTESSVLSCTCYNCGYTWRQESYSSAQATTEEPMRVRVTEDYGGGATVTHEGTYTPSKDRKIRWTENGGIEVLIDGKWTPALASDMPQVVKDRTKARFDLLPWGPIWKMAETMTNGARKPGRVAHNWRKGTDWSDYSAAMMRHAALWQQGEDFEIDHDTGARIDHLAAVMCCAAILLEYQMFSLGTDDRFPAGHPAYKGDRK